MRQLKTLFVLAVVAFLAAPAFAETQNVKVSGSEDMYGFYRSNFDLLNNNDAASVPAGTAVPGQSHGSSTAQRSDSEGFFMSITQLQVSADLTDNVSTVVSLINQRDWNKSEAGDGTPVGTNEFNVDLNLAYVQMKEIFYAPLTLTVGRQDIVLGRGFIVGWNPQNYHNQIGAAEFTQEQAFDAVRATLDFNPWTIDFIYSNIANVANAAGEGSNLYIANVNYKFAEYNAVAEAYYVGQFDKNTISGLAGGRDNDTDTIGGRVQFDPISQLTLGGELAYQFGHYELSTPSGFSDRSRDALAADVFGEYRFDNPWKPMVGLEYIYLSGESDLSAHGSSSYGAWNGAFQSSTYGWIHTYLNVLYATAQGNDQAAGQDQENISVYGSISPLTDLKLSAQYYHFWSPATKHVVTTNPNSASLNNDIGDEIDTTIAYNYTEDVTFSIYANWFIPGNLYSSPNNATASEYVSEVKVTF